MAAIVKMLHFISSYGHRRMDPVPSAERHIKYMLEDKEHHKNKPVLFNQDQDKVKQEDFFHRLSHQNNSGIVMHKWVLSLSEQERDRLQIDMQQLTRDLMERIQMQYNVRLDWVAAVHDDEGHPHVHIAIRGKSSSEYHSRQFTVDQKHIREIRKMSDEEKMKQAERHLGKAQAQKIMKKIDRELNPQKRRSKGFLDNFIQNLVMEAEKANKKAVREQAQEQQREERKRSNNRDR